MRQNFSFCFFSVHLLAIITLACGDAHLRQDFKAENNRPVLPNTLAVLYFRNVAELNEWQPLLKGVAAILIADLGKVRRLRLVERGQVEALLQEHGLSSAQLYDRFTAPRAGRVLGAQRVIVGGAMAVGEAGILIDAGVLETANGDMIGRSVSSGGRLSEILRVEKELLFGLLDQLGIKLSDEEHAALQQPTTHSALAFASYCRGLDYADRHDFANARKAFKEALRQDSDFTEAKKEMEKLEITEREE